MTAQTGPRILVPILDGDIGRATLAAARSALHAPRASLVLLHVVPLGVVFGPPPPAHRAHGTMPRWRMLAEAAPVFLDAVAGDPATVILSQADRFHSDLVLLGRPARVTPQNAWIADVVDRVTRSGLARVQVLVERMPRRRAHTRSAGRNRRATTRTVEAS